MRWFSSLLFISFSLTVSAGSETPIKLYADSWAPYNFSQNGTPTGVATDLVREVFEEAGIPYQLSIQPWKRAYQNTLRTPETGLFVVNKTEARSQQFKWVGPLFESRVALYRLKSRQGIVISRLLDLNHYRTGVLASGSVYAFLKRFGIDDEHLDIHSYAGQHLIKLFAERIDLVPGDELDLAYQVKGFERDFNELEEAHFLYWGAYYLALNSTTPDSLVNQLQAALDKVVAEGTREQIIRRYISPMQP